MGTEDNLIDIEKTSVEDLKSLEVEAVTPDAVTDAYPDLSVNQAEASNVKVADYPDFSVNKPDVDSAFESVIEVEPSDESIASKDINQTSEAAKKPQLLGIEPTKSSSNVKSDLTKASPITQGLPEMHGDIDSFLKALFKSEGGGKDIDVENKFGYIGKYQFGEDALNDIGYYAGDNSKNRAQLPNGKSQFQYDWHGDWTGKNGATSKDAFLKSEATQDAAARDWVKYLCKTMKHFKLDKYIGETFAGVEVTESGIIAAAHLKGFGSAKHSGVIQFLRSGGEINAQDGFGTSISKYMAKFKGYELGCCGALTVHLFDRHKQPITGVKYEVKNKGKVVKKGTTDTEGRTAKVTGGAHSSPLSVWIERIEGGFKEITSLLMPSTIADLVLISPKVKVNADLNQHKGASGQYKRQQADNKAHVVKKNDRNINGHPVVVATSVPIAIEKSGVQWCSRFIQSSKTDDLKEPFRGNVNEFISALKAGGVVVTVNTTWRPPQRSYLMYYAREIVNGHLAPTDVPPFIPQNGDEPVNIDWAHIGLNGDSDIDAAKKSAIEMDGQYAAKQAIGKPYKSNHNGAEAIDMKFSPQWGVGKTIKNKTGDLVEIKSKADIIAIGATYGVLHWNYAGVKNKLDDPHWSKTGN